MPDLEWIQRFGHGVTQQQAEDLQKNGKVLVLTFAHPKEHVFDGLFNAVKLAHSLAQFTDGVIWDDATSEMFSTTAWEERRFKGWDAGVPDVSMQTTIHAYKKDEYVRAITLGMTKFGLPDLVIGSMFVVTSAQRRPYSESVWSVIGGRRDYHQTR